MDCITKIYDAITACQEKDKQPKCILCRDEFYNDLLAECEDLSFGNERQEDDAGGLRRRGVQQSANCHVLPRKKRP